MFELHLWSAVVTVVSTSGHSEKINQLQPGFEISVLIDKIATVFDKRPAFIKLSLGDVVISEDLYATLSATGIRESSQLSMVIVKPTTAKASLHVQQLHSTLAVLEYNGSLDFKVPGDIKMFELCADEESGTFQLLDLPGFEKTTFVIAKFGDSNYLMTAARDNYMIWDKKKKGFREVSRFDDNALEVMELDFVMKPRWNFYTSVRSIRFYNRFLICEGEPQVMFHGDCYDQNKFVANETDSDCF